MAPPESNQSQDDQGFYRGNILGRDDNDRVIISSNPGGSTKIPWAEVDWVDDDTFKWSGTRYRLAGINAPETTGDVPEDVYQGQYRGRPEGFSVDTPADVPLYPQLPDEPSQSISKELALYGHADDAADIVDRLAPPRASAYTHYGGMIDPAYKEDLSRWIEWFDRKQARNPEVPLSFFVNSDPGDLELMGDDPYMIGELVAEDQIIEAYNVVEDYSRQRAHMIADREGLPSGDARISRVEELTKEIMNIHGYGLNSREAAAEFRAKQIRLLAQQIHRRERDRHGDSRGYISLVSGDRYSEPGTHSPEDRLDDIIAYISRWWDPSLTGAGFVETFGKVFAGLEDVYSQSPLVRYSGLRPDEAYEQEQQGGGSLWKKIGSAVATWGWRAGVHIPYQFLLKPVVDLGFALGELVPGLGTHIRSTEEARVEQVTSMFDEEHAELTIADQRLLTEMGATAFNALPPDMQQQIMREANGNEAIAFGLAWAQMERINPAFTSQQMAAYDTYEGEHAAAMAEIANTRDKLEAGARDISIGDALMSALSWWDSVVGNIGVSAALILKGDIHTVFGGDGNIIENVIRNYNEYDRRASNVFGQGDRWYGIATDIAFSFIFDPFTWLAPPVTSIKNAIRMGSEKGVKKYVRSSAFKYHTMNMVRNLNPSLRDVRSSYRNFSRDFWNYSPEQLGNVEHALRVLEASGGSDEAAQLLQDTVWKINETNMFRGVRFHKHYRAQFWNMTAGAIRRLSSPVTNRQVSKNAWNALFKVMPKKLRAARFPTSSSMSSEMASAFIHSIVNPRVSPKKYDNILRGWIKLNTEEKYIKRISSLPRNTDGAIKRGGGRLNPEVARTTTGTSRRILVPFLSRVEESVTHAPTSRIDIESIPKEAFANPDSFLYNEGTQGRSYLDLYPEGTAFWSKDEEMWLNTRAHVADQVGDEVTEEKIKSVLEELGLEDIMDVDGITAEEWHDDVIVSIALSRMKRDFAIRKYDKYRWRPKSRWARRRAKKNARDAGRDPHADTPDGVDRFNEGEGAQDGRRVVEGPDGVRTEEPIEYVEPVVDPKDTSKGGEPVEPLNTWRPWAYDPRSYESGVPGADNVLYRSRQGDDGVQRRTDILFTYRRDRLTDTGFIEKDGRLVRSGHRFDSYDRLKGDQWADSVLWSKHKEKKFVRIATVLKEEADGTKFAREELEDLMADLGMENALDKLDVAISDDEWVERALDWFYGEFRTGEWARLVGVDEALVGENMWTWANLPYLEQFDVERWGFREGAPFFTPTLFEAPLTREEIGSLGSMVEFLKKWTPEEGVFKEYPDLWKDTFKNWGPDVQAAIKRAAGKATGDSHKDQMAVYEATKKWLRDSRIGRRERYQPNKRFDYEFEGDDTEALVDGAGDWRARMAARGHDLEEIKARRQTYDPDPEYTEADFDEDLADLEDAVDSAIREDLARYEVGSGDLGWGTFSSVELGREQAAYRQSREYVYPLHGDIKPNEHWSQVEENQLRLVRAILLDKGGPGADDTFVREQMEMVAGIVGDYKSADEAYETLSAWYTAERNRRYSQAGIVDPSSGEEVVTVQGRSWNRLRLAGFLGSALVGLPILAALFSIANAPEAMAAPNEINPDARDRSDRPWWLYGAVLGGTGLGALAYVGIARVLGKILYGDGSRNAVRLRRELLRGYEDKIYNPVKGYKTYRKMMSAAARFSDDPHKHQFRQEFLQWALTSDADILLKTPPEIFKLDRASFKYAEVSDAWGFLRHLVGTSEERYLPELVDQLKRLERHARDIGDTKAQGFLRSLYDARVRGTDPSTLGSATMYRGTPKYNVRGRALQLNKDAPLGRFRNVEEYLREQQNVELEAEMLGVNVHHNAEFNLEFVKRYERISSMHIRLQEEPIVDRFEGLGSGIDLENVEPAGLQRKDEELAGIGSNQGDVEENWDVLRVVGEALHLAEQEMKHFVQTNVPIPAHTRLLKPTEVDLEFTSFDPDYLGDPTVEDVVTQTVWGPKRREELQEMLQNVDATLDVADSILSGKPKVDRVVTQAELYDLLIRAGSREQARKAGVAIAALEKPGHYNMFSYRDEDFEFINEYGKAVREVGGVSEVWWFGSMVHGADAGAGKSDFDVMVVIPGYRTAGEATEERVAKIKEQISRITLDVRGRTSQIVNPVFADAGELDNLESHFWKFISPRRVRIDGGTGGPADLKLWRYWGPKHEALMDRRFVAAAQVERFVDRLDRHAEQLDAGNLDVFLDSEGLLSADFKALMETRWQLYGSHRRFEASKTQAYHKNLLASGPDFDKLDEWIEAQGLAEYAWDPVFFDYLKGVRDIQANPELTPTISLTTLFGHAISNSTAQEYESLARRRWVDVQAQGADLPTYSAVMQYYGQARDRLAALADGYVTAAGFAGKFDNRGFFRHADFVYDEHVEQLEAPWWNSVWLKRVAGGGAMLATGAIAWQAFANARDSEDTLMNGFASAGSNLAVMGMGGGWWSLLGWGGLVLSGGMGARLANSLRRSAAAVGEEAAVSFTLRSEAPEFVQTISDVYDTRANFLRSLLDEVKEVEDWGDVHIMNNTTVSSRRFVSDRGEPDLNVWETPAEHLEKMLNDEVRSLEQFKKRVDSAIEAERSGVSDMIAREVGVAMPHGTGAWARQINSRMDSMFTAAGLERVQPENEFWFQSWTIREIEPDYPVRMAQDHRDMVAEWTAIREELEGLEGGMASEAYTWVLDQENALRRHSEIWDAAEAEPDATLDLLADPAVYMDKNQWEAKVEGWRSARDMRVEQFKFRMKEFTEEADRERRYTGSIAVVGAGHHFYSRVCPSVAGCCFGGIWVTGVWSLV